MATSAASLDITASFGAPGDGPEFMARVASGDPDAQRRLASRLVARVRRAAHAFMPRSIDADDAALHALIEILRSAHTFRDGTIERWADGVLSRSIVRFARAVRRRNGENLSEDELLPDERTPTRSLENGLRRIPPARRDVLLLRHVLGHSLEQIAEVTQTSPSMVQERLLGARRELRRIHPVEAGSAAERWAVLRDRDAIAENLTDRELAELAEIERSSVTANVYAAQQEELAALLSLRPGDRSEFDGHIVDRALLALQVTNQPLRASMGDPDADLESAVDPEGPRWLRSGAIAVSVLLSVTALVSLALFEPRAPHVKPMVQTSEPEIVPTVEALTSAHAGRRGGRLRRLGAVVPAGSPLGVGQTLSAPDRPACFDIQPAIEVCLATGASVRIDSLALQKSVVEVLEGRAVVTHEGQAGSIELVSGDVRARPLGTVFGLERSADGSTVKVRVLQGHVEVASPFGVTMPGPQQVAVVRRNQAQNQLENLPEGQAQREWELRATGLPLSALPPSARVAPASVERAALLPEDELTAPVPGQASDTEAPHRLMEEAWEQLKSKHFVEAASLYERILREHPRSEEAHVVLVRLGDVQLSRLGEPESALVSFERYMREGSGPLQAEAMHGRIEALARLGRTDDELAAIEDYLHMYPTGLKADALRARLMKRVP